MKNEQFITTENVGSTEVVGLIKEIQVELMRRKYNNYEPSNDECMEWIGMYSKKFRTIFDRLIKADPHFWLHDQQTRNATLDIIEEELSTV